jgi:hypothetical protein
MDDNLAIEAAVALIDAYRVPSHDAALRILNEYVDEHGRDQLPAIWHHFARIVADVYTTAGLTVLPPEGPPPTDRYEIYDDHARRLTILCQQDNVDARPAVAAYAAELGEGADWSLLEGITLCLASKIAESESTDVEDD